VVVSFGDISIPRVVRTVMQLVALRYGMSVDFEAREEALKSAHTVECKGCD